MTRPGLLVDAHVHVHACFAWSEFLDAAVANLTKGRSQSGLPPQSTGCLMLTESHGANWFKTMVRRPSAARAAGWQMAIEEDHSFVLVRGGERLVIVAGRQLATAERLEVLALGCAHELPDGRPLRDVLQAVVDCDAIPVVPWGFGKWMGVRRRLLHRLIERPDRPHFCLGDNAGRLRGVRRSSLFDHAEHFGMLVLAGSDPLPLVTHVARAGSYGFILDDWQDTPRPAHAILSRIRTLQRSPRVFGELSSVSAALQSQVGLRLRWPGTAEGEGLASI